MATPQCIHADGTTDAKCAGRKQPNELALLARNSQHTWHCPRTLLQPLLKLQTIKAALGEGDAHPTATRHTARTTHPCCNPSNTARNSHKPAQSQPVTPATVQHHATPAGQVHTSRLPHGTVASAPASSEPVPTQPGTHRAKSACSTSSRTVRPNAATTIRVHQPSCQHEEGNAGGAQPPRAPQDPTNGDGALNLHHT